MKAFLFYFIMFLVPFVSAAQKEQTIVFYGTSLSAGFGLDPDQAYPHLIQQKLDEEGHQYKVTNESISGETTAGGLTRIEGVLNKYEPDIFVLELGANDGLQRLPIRQIQKNLEAIVESVKKQYPQAKLIIVGMRLPPNFGTNYVRSFENIFPWLANKYDATLLPFLLEGVVGNPDLNLPDRVHPNVEGQQKLAETVWHTIKEVL